MVKFWRSGLIDPARARVGFPLGLLGSACGAALVLAVPGRQPQADRAGAARRRRPLHRPSARQARGPRRGRPAAALAGRRRDRRAHRPRHRRLRRLLRPRHRHLPHRRLRGPARRRPGPRLGRRQGGQLRLQPGRPGPLRLARPGGLAGGAPHGRRASSAAAGSARTSPCAAATRWSGGSRSSRRWRWPSSWPSTSARPGPRRPRTAGCSLAEADRFPPGRGRWYRAALHHRLGSTTPHVTHRHRPGSRLRHPVRATASSSTASPPRPQQLIEAMTARADELRVVEVVHLHTEGAAPYAAPELARSFRVNALFVGANVREAVHEGRADYLPVFLSEVPQLFRAGVLPLDVALIQVSPPDRHGFCSLGVSVDVTRAAVQMARTVIAQVNPSMPRTHGDGLIHRTTSTSSSPVDDPIPEAAHHPPHRRRAGDRPPLRRAGRGRRHPADRHRRHPRRHAGRRCATTTGSASTPRCSPTAWSTWSSAASSPAR